jgi:hypothetical protein
MTGYHRFSSLSVNLVVRSSKKNHNLLSRERIEVLRKLGDFVISAICQDMPP